MNTEGYHARILVFAAAVLGVMAVLIAWIPITEPSVLEIDADAVHGVTALDRAQLRRILDIPVMALPTDNQFAGPVVSLRSFSLPGLTPKESNNWWIAHPATLSAIRSRPDLNNANVVILRGKTETDCAQKGSRFSCGPKSWNYVGPTKLTISGVESECIWAHPLSNAKIRVTYPSLDAGKWQLRFGLSDRAVGGGIPIDVHVTRGAFSKNHAHADRRGWTTLDVPPASGPLVIEISAKNTGRRHFCYQLEAQP